MRVTSVLLVLILIGSSSALSATSMAAAMEGRTCAAAARVSTRECLLPQEIQPYPAMMESELALMPEGADADPGREPPQTAFGWQVAGLDDQLRHSLSASASRAPAVTSSGAGRGRERAAPSRLSSRLESSSNSLLRSRIHRPSPRVEQRSPFDSGYRQR